MALFPPVTGHVDRRHELEARVVEAFVLRGRPGAGLHIGLAEAEVDVEIGIGPLCEGLQSQGQGRQGQDETFEHIDAVELAMLVRVVSQNYVHRGKNAKPERNPKLNMDIYYSDLFTNLPCKSKRK